MIPAVHNGGTTPRYNVRNNFMPTSSFANFWPICIRVFNVSKGWPTNIPHAPANVPERAELIEFVNKEVGRFIVVVSSLFLSIVDWLNNKVLKMNKPSRH
jgi:hypothetical protein